MLILEGIKALPSQVFRVPIDQGIVKIQLDHKPAIEMWFINIEFNDFILNGVRVCRNINLLQSYSKLIPFGIYVQCDSGVEPILIDDFSSGRVILNILTDAEKESINRGYEVR